MKNEKINSKKAESKRAEETLQESVEKLNALFRSIGEYISLLDKDLNILCTNDMAKELFGDEIIGKKCYEVFHGRDNPCEPSPCLTLKAFEDGQVHKHETQVITKRGEIKYFHCTANVALRDEAGNPTAVLELSKDITEYKQAEEMLRIERDNLKNIFEAMKDGVYIVNQQYDIQYVNPVLVKDFGVYEGRKCYEYFHDRMEVCPWCKNPDVFAGKTVRWEWYSFKNQRTYDLIDTSLKNPDGSLSKLEIFRDITKRKLAENQVLKYQKQLQQMGSKMAMAEERQRRQIATILHDNIGQDLALSMLKLNTLKKSISSKDIAAGLDEVNKTIEKTIQDTRTLSFDLSSPILYRFGFVRAIEQWISEQVHKKHGIKTRFIKNRQVKQLDKDVSIVLFQATREALINVIKHAQAKSVEVSVTQIDGKIKVIVEDDGVGFEISEIGRFIHKNGGFGLFNVRERLNYFGGDIRIESKPENGTRVVLAIPTKAEKKDGDN